MKHSDGAGRSVVTATPVLGNIVPQGDRVCNKFHSTRGLWAMPRPSVGGAWPRNAMSDEPQSMSRPSSAQRARAAGWRFCGAKYYPVIDGGERHGTAPERQRRGPRAAGKVAS